MEFVYNLRNFEAGEELKEHFEKRLNGLKRILQTFGHFEKRASILIDKLPKGQYLARVNLHLPKHHIEAEDTGYTPVEALHEAVDNARTQVIKIKESYAKFHNPEGALFRRGEFL